MLKYQLDLAENTEEVSWWYWYMCAVRHNDGYFHRPVLLSPMIFPSLCLTVRGLDLGLEATRATLTALAAAEGYKNSTKLYKTNIERNIVYMNAGKQKVQTFTIT